MFLENGKGGIFQSGTFQIDPNATPEQLARKRALMTAMMPQFGRARYVGEGVGQALTGLAMGLKGRQLDKFEAQKRKEATDSLAGLTIGAGAYGAQQPTYSPFVPWDSYASPPRPTATDPLEMGGGGYALGDSVADPEMAASPKGNLAMGVETYNPDDREMLAKTLMAEAGGEGAQGMLAAGAVIDNRRKAGGYGNDWQGVIMKPGQFSAWNGVTGYAGGKGGLNMDGMKPSQAAYQVADALLSGRYDDPTGGATHYYNPAAANPAWGMQAGGEWQRIGNHVFGMADAGRAQSGYGVPTGPSVTDLQAALANPWLTQPQRQQIQDMIDTQQAYRNSMQERAWRREDADYERQLARQDPMYQLKLKQAQLDYDQDKAGVGGVSGAFGNLDAQAKAAGLQPGTPEYQQFMLNSGGAPATFRALDMQAKAAGFEPGTPEYAEFMATRGAGLQAGAKTTATNEANIATGGEAERVKAAGAAQGKQDVENRSELAEMERNMPSLLVVVDELDKLAGEATYTKAGQLRDWWFKETGQEPTNAAVARAKYIAMVDNQVLPLLRQTFGAQFTAQEGESLKKTLGDPDKTPAEKRAVLDAFIAQKQRDLQARYRQSGMVPVETPPPPPAGTAKTFEEFSADPSAKAAAEKYGVTLEEMWNIKQGGR